MDCCEASRWPRDDEFRKHWLSAEIYPGRLDAAKLRAMFHRLEIAMRSARTEEKVVLSLDDMDGEHITAAIWAEYWPLANSMAVSQQEVSDAASCCRTQRRS